MKTILIGAGSHLGVHIDGAAFGAEHLVRKAGEQPHRLFMQDLDFVKSKAADDLRKNEKEIEKYNTALYQLMLTEIQNGAFPILLGGDHSVAVASALASNQAHGDLGIIWLDAHTDFNTFASTVTGNIHGLPLAAITGYHCEELRTFHKGPVIDPHKAVVVGARAVDPEEWTNLRDAGVTVFTTEDIQLMGASEVMERAFRIAGEKAHVSYDLDLIDPKTAPGVSVPETEGISEQEAMDLVAELTRNIDKIVSFDLVELNPLRDLNGRTEDLAVRILDQIVEAVKNK